MMKMHDIRFDRAQQRDERVDQCRFVIPVQPIIMIGLMQQIDTFAPFEPGDAGFRLVHVARLAIDRGEHGAFDPGSATQFLKQLLANHG